VEVVVLLRIFAPATKLDAFFIHVSVVLCWDVGIVVIKVLEEFEVATDIHHVEVLGSF